MNTELHSFLLAAPRTAKEIAAHLNVSSNTVRGMLKEDQATIRCRKNTTGQNEFYVESDFEATEEELAAQKTRQEVQAAKAETALVETPKEVGSDTGTNTCPLCQATAEQVQAGPEGSYLGACRVCSACKKTFNVYSNEEVKMAKEKSTDAKRAAPLNPQYKINGKIAAAEAAGGKLTYQREGRTWLLSKRGQDPKQMTAVEFSNETPESISKLLGKEFIAPARAPRAERAPKADAAPKAAKAVKPKADKVPAKKAKTKTKELENA